jgi:hypothetical protein
MLGRGGIAGQVRAGLDAQYKTIAGAFSSGSPGDLKILMCDPQLPVELRDSLGHIPPSVLADPRARAAALAQVKERMDAQAPAIVEQAAAAALSRIRAALDARAEALTAQVTDALKKAFTDAITRIYLWEMFVAGAALLLALFLPGGALRKAAAAGRAAGTAAPPAGH